MRKREIRLVRIGSRTGEPPFDWENNQTWAPVLQGVTAAYINFYPDVALPQAAIAIDAFAKLAVQSGGERLVLLAERGKDGSERSEQALRESGAEWTIIRASWFCQNFSEGYLQDNSV